jgi:hypothetical protein
VAEQASENCARFAMAQSLLGPPIATPAVYGAKPNSCSIPLGTRETGDVYRTSGFQSSVW